MNIALIADDTKKELMCQFCEAYCGILCKHDIYATAVTANYISSATGLKINSLLSGGFGGTSQIASRIQYGEVDMLLNFIGTREESYANTDFIELVKLCNLYNIPMATNIGTAEALVMALDRGDLDWRLYVGKKNPIV